MRILDIALKDVYQVVRDWKAPAFMIAMPIFFTIFMGIGFQGNAETDARLAVGVIDQDSMGGEPATLSVALLDLLEASAAIRSVVLDGGEADRVEKMIGDEKLFAALIIPAGYSADLLGGDTGQLTVIYDEGSTAGHTARNEIQAVTLRLLSAVEAARIGVEAYEAKATFDGQAAREAYFESGLTHALEAWRDPPVSVETSRSGRGDDGESSEGEKFNSFAQSSSAMIVQFGLAGLIGAAELLVKERKSRSLPRMLTTPTTRATIVGGKLLAGFALVALQIVALALFGQLVYDLPYFTHPGPLLLMIAAVAFCFASIGMLVGAIAKSDEAAIVLVMIPMCVFSALGGAWLPLEFTSGTVQTIGHVVTPTAWAMDGLKNIIVRGQGVEAALLPAGIVTLWGIVFFGLAVWRLRFVE